MRATRSSCTGTGASGGTSPSWTTPWPRLPPPSSARPSALNATELDEGLVGETLNVARGRTVRLSDVIETIGLVTGRELEVVQTAREIGDVRVTSAVIDRAARILDYAPVIDLSEGIRRQWAHVQDQP